MRLAERVRLTEDISVKRWQPADLEATAACHAVEVAAHLVEDQVEPPETAGVFDLRLRGWGHTPGEVWYVPSATVAGGGAAGPVAAFCQISLPDLENLDRAGVDLRVHPALRRRGVGGALLRHAALRAAAHDRSILEFTVRAGLDGDRFLRSLGATLEIEEVRRIQELRKIPPGRVAGLRAEAERRAAGYSLVRWTGPVPDEYLGHVAGVYNAMNDAPRGENVQDERWDAGRVRERSGNPQRAGLMRGYAVAAMHDAGGEMAALTEVLIDPVHPDWGYQQVTAVTQAHRGHRLGLLVKTAMLEWLTEAEPRLEWIETGNAASNKHMIAVNEMLGYVVADPRWRFYEIEVAKVLGGQS